MPLQVRRTGIEGAFVDTQNLDVAGLLALLAGLPDAAMPPPPSPFAPNTLLGASFLLLALSSAAPRWKRRPPEATPER